MAKVVENHVRRGTSRIPYRTVRELLEHELLREEDEGAAQLIQRLRHVRKDKLLSREEFLANCQWKSPRAAGRYARNREKAIAATVKAALYTWSERRRLAYLTRKA